MFCYSTLAHLQNDETPASENNKRDTSVIHKVSLFWLFNASDTLHASSSSVLTSAQFIMSLFFIRQENYILPFVTFIEKIFKILT